MENNQANNPTSFVQKEQNKDTNFQPIKLNPTFDNVINSNVIINHINELKNNTLSIPHTEILTQLIEQFDPLDFELLAFPQVEKLRNKI